MLPNFIYYFQLSKILQTIMTNRERMPCFDPREVMFLTNQWDIIDNEEASSDDETDSGSDKEDQHTQTWNLIQRKLSNGWGWFNVENVFRISLKQVKLYMCMHIFLLPVKVSPRSC